MVTIGIALFFVLKALEERIVFFYSPSELLQKKSISKNLIRVGGLVLKDSINYNSNGLEVTFFVTDKKKKLKISYEGILPDLFREGQGVVVEGKIGIDKEIFYADKVLAKHDENYMPPEVKKIIDN
tara:strand:+ start:1116 stop:1493 length:378 start_codon:yes stop_codon:yes gene_type:complete